MGFSEKVKEIIEKQGVTQSELALKMGVTRQSISSALKQAKPHSKTIEAFAKALGVPASELAENDEDNNVNVQFAERLKEVMERYGVSGPDLSERTGIAQPVLNGILLAKTSPSMNIIASITKVFPLVSIDWILHGSGSMNEIRNSLDEGLFIAKSVNAIKQLQSEAEPIDIPQPGEEHELELIRRVDSTEFRRIDDDLYMVICPLVPEYAYAGYCASWSDHAYIEDLPKHAVLMRNLTFGDYRAFTVRGDSMDNGLKGAISEGDIVTGRKLYEKHWRNKMHIHKYKNFILVTNEGIMIKELIEHRVEEGIVVCRSLNPDKAKYPDFELSLANVREIYYVKARTEPLE